jgi:hypothetical protein
MALMAPRVRVRGRARATPNPTRTQRGALPAFPPVPHAGSERKGGIWQCVPGGAGTAAAETIAIAIPALGVPALAVNQRCDREFYGGELPDDFTALRRSDDGHQDRARFAVGEWFARDLHNMLFGAWQDFRALGTDTVMAARELNSDPHGPELIGSLLTKLLVWSCLRIFAIRIPREIYFRFFPRPNLNGQYFASLHSPFHVAKFYALNLQIFTIQNRLLGYFSCRDWQVGRPSWPIKVALVNREICRISERFSAHAWVVAVDSSSLSPHLELHLSLFLAA